MSEDWEATDWEATNLGGYNYKSVPEFSTGIATSSRSQPSVKKYPSNTNLTGSKPNLRTQDLKSQNINNQRSQIQTKNIGYPTTAAPVATVGDPNTVSRRRAKQKNPQHYRTEYRLSRRAVGLSPDAEDTKAVTTNQR